MYEPLQTLDNPALRPFLKIGPAVQGIIVRQPESADPAYPLREWDIISRIADAPVDNQGTVKVKNNLRVRFQYLIQRNTKDGKVPMTVVRDGKEVRIELPLVKQRPRVIPDLMGAHPSYFIYGPLAFSEATTQLVNDYGDGNRAAEWLLDLGYTGSPLIARAGDKPRFPGERLVFVCAPFFPHKLAKGYGNPSQQVVKTVNGTELKNLAHLVEILRDSRDEFVVVKFDLNGGGETLVFPRAEMLTATEDILNDNGVRSQGSPDMMAVWNAKPTEP